MLMDKNCPQNRLEAFEAIKKIRATPRKTKFPKGKAVRPFRKPTVLFNAQKISDFLDYSQEMTGVYKVYKVFRYHLVTFGAF